MGVPRTVDILLSAVICIYAAGFLLGRVGEWALTVLRRPWESIAGLLVIILSNVALPRMNVFVPSLKVQLVAVVAVVYYYWDVATADLSSPEVDLTGKVAVVTGANSGIGFHTAMALLSRNATVVMACRSERKCASAAQDAMQRVRARIGAGMPLGLSVPMVLDLGDLVSVHTFAGSFAEQFPRVDIIVNNAGFNQAGSIEPEPPTAQGLESHFGSMHVGHFVLTERLLQQNSGGADRVNVVNVASGMHHFCVPSFIVQAWTGGGFDDACLPKSFLQNGFAETGEMLDFVAVPGLQARLPRRLAALWNWQQVVGDQRYVRAKLANVLHAAELPKRHAGVSAYSVDLGFVVTGITSWMRLMQRYPILQSLGLVRLVEPHGIRPVLLAACWPYAKNWRERRGLAPLPNGWLVDPAGLATRPFVIEQKLEAMFGVSKEAPNRTVLAAELFDATEAVMASFTSH